MPPGDFLVAHLLADSSLVNSVTYILTLSALLRHLLQIGGKVTFIRARCLFQPANIKGAFANCRFYKQPCRSK